MQQKGLNFRSFYDKIRAYIYKWIIEPPKEDAGIVKERIIKITIQVDKQNKIQIEMANDLTLEDAVAASSAAVQRAMDILQQQAENQKNLKALTDTIKADADKLNAAIEAVTKTS